jgi:aldehyde dehydrogenase (NAD+)
MSETSNHHQGKTMRENVNLVNLDKLYIAGEWLRPTESGRIDVVSPDNEQVVAGVAEAGKTDVEKAVGAARAAFDDGPWPRMRPAERIAMLRALTEKLREREPELGAAWTLQVGGLASTAGYLTKLGTANMDNALDVAGTFAFEERVSSKSASAAMVVHDPVGVVAAIVPWNSPYMLTTSKIAPALAAGCTVVMKPSPETPLEAYIIAECAHEVGLPAGTLNLVTADREASDALVCNNGVDKVSFTGSTATGRRVAAVCSQRIARCTLELGGKSAAIVLDDFPIDEAAKLLTRTITMLSGQICSMLSRAIVSRTRYKALAEAIAHEMSTIKVGHSDDIAAQMGPVASKRQLERVQQYIAKGKSEGATLAAGGGRPAHLKKGYFIEPTLFTDVDNRMTIAQEEIFGPVLCLIPCDNVDDAIRIANDTIYGLNASVLTRDNDAAYAVGRRTRSGKFAQNGLRTDFCLPSGGCKQSGIGREGGPEGLKAYLETRVMLLDGFPTGSQPH